MTEIFHIEFVQGEEFEVVHDIIEEDDPNTLDEIEANTEAEWRVSKYSDTTPLVVVEDADIEKLSYNPGVLKFRINSADTIDLRGEYYHEFEIDEPTHGKSITMRGSIWVDESNDN